jgi:hypothetical protein
MATSALMAIRINDSLGLRRKLTRVMFCSVVAGKKHFMFFSRQKSPRCSLGHHLPALISSYLAGDNTSSKKLPATKDSTV